MEKKVTPAQIIDLIKSLPESDKHIFFEDGKYYVTNEWLTGGFVGRSFVSDFSFENAAFLLIDYLYHHLNHCSMVGREVTKSGFPDLVKVKKYCFSSWTKRRLKITQ